MRRTGRWIAWIIILRDAARPRIGPGRRAAAPVSHPRGLAPEPLASPQGPAWPRRRDRSCRSPRACPGMTSMPGSTWRPQGLRPRAGPVHEPVEPGDERAGLSRLPSLPGQGPGQGDPVQDAGDPPAQPRRGHGYPGAAAEVAVGRRWRGRQPRFAFDPEARHDHDRAAAASRSDPGGSVTAEVDVRARPARLLGPLGASQRRSPTCSTGIPSWRTTTTRGGSGRRSSPGTSRGTRRRATTRFSFDLPGRPGRRLDRAGSADRAHGRAGPAARHHRRPPRA